jgi:hypothetical protein
MSDDARGVRLRDAVQTLADQEADAIFWRDHWHSWMDLSAPAIERWLDIDIALMQQAKEMLASGKWSVEGFRSGITIPERPSAAWWRRDIKLNLGQETAEWHGVELGGLVVFDAGPEAKLTKDLARNRNVALAEAKRRLRDYAIRYKEDNKGRKVSRAEAVQWCRDPVSGPGATQDVAIALYQALPPDLKAGRGERIGGK